MLQESFDSPIDRRSDYYRQQARQKKPPADAARAGPEPLFTPPNVLTFARIVLVPVFVVLW